MAHRAPNHDEFSCARSVRKDRAVAGSAAWIKRSPSGISGALNPVWGRGDFFLSLGVKPHADGHAFLSRTPLCLRGLGTLSPRRWSNGCARGWLLNQPAEPSVELERSLPADELGGGPAGETLRGERAEAGRCCERDEGDEGELAVVPARPQVTGASPVLAIASMDEQPFPDARWPLRTGIGAGPYWPRPGRGCCEECSPRQPSDAGAFIATIRDVRSVDGPAEEAAAGNLRRTSFLWIGIPDPALAAM